MLVLALPDASVVPLAAGVRVAEAQGEALPEAETVEENRATLPLGASESEA